MHLFFQDDHCRMEHIDRSALNKSSNNKANKDHNIMVKHKKLLKRGLTGVPQTTGALG